EVRLGVARAARTWKGPHPSQGAALLCTSTKKGDSGPGHGAAQRLQGCGGDAAVDPHSPDHVPVDLGLDVGGGTGVAVLPHGVLDVVDDADLGVDVGQRVTERGDRTIAGAGQLTDLAVDAGVCLDPVGSVLGGAGTVGHDRHGAVLAQVFLTEDRPDVLGLDLAAVGVGVFLD